jgi:hypothetical protein
MLNFKKECPRCHKLTGEYHLMMGECDECINKNSVVNYDSQEFINVNGILRKNATR